MMQALPNIAEALLAAQFNCPAGFRTWNASDPTTRFAVYRNNVWLGLLNAMNSTFPVCRRWAGAELFEFLARAFIAEYPPQSPIMLHFGEDFSSFLQAQTLTPDALPDLAHLEWQYVSAFHGADAPALPHETWVALLEDEMALAEMVFHLHPALRLVRSPYAIFSLWAAAQQDQPFTAINVHQPESGVILRQGYNTIMRTIHDDFAEMLTKIAHGQTFACATHDLPEDFDLASALALLIQHGTFIAPSPSSPQSVQH